MEGNEFDEWGVQQLRKQNKISAYIISKSNEAFRISIRPDFFDLTPTIPPSTEGKSGRDIQLDADEGTFGDPHTHRKSLAYALCLR